MQEKGVHLSAKELDKIFPYFLILNKEAQIEQVGRSISKLFPNVEIQQDFFKQWQVVRPNSSSIQEVLGVLCVLEFTENPMIQLKGHFEEIESSGKFIFYGTPAFTSSNQIVENDLTLHDFALNDTTFDLLHVLKTNEIANTELKELLEKVNDQRKDLSLFKQIIDSSSDAIQVAYESGRLFYINKIASERLGIPMKDASNHFVSDFEEVFQIDPDAWMNHLKDVQSNNLIMIEGFNKNQTTQESFPVEVTAKHMTIDGKGLVIAISRDISERKEHEKILKLQQDKFQNIISNMNLGLMEVDSNDKILFCNQSFERMSGYNLDEVVGKEARKLFMPEDSQSIIEDKEESRKKGESDSYEVKAQNKNKEEKWWLISGAPNFDESGNLIGSIGIHLDITEQKKLEQELEVAYKNSQQASEAKEAFLANMSHEIRTPLNAIIGMIRELSREKLSAKQQGFLRHTDSAANHLLSIVNSILDMSKIEAGEFELDQYDFSLPALIGNIQSILMSKAQRKNLEFSVKIDKSIYPAHLGDGPRLRQIFINLLDNAIKFTEKGNIELEAIELSNSEKDQKIRFVISDTGIGMDEGYLKEIFTKFSQAEKSTSRRFGGTGLGMPITRELIQIMGGEISVESEVGRGTSITIDLTLPKGAVSSLQLKSRVAEKNALKKTRVLLVEDNEMNRFIALQSLQFLGCLVEEAENGLVALEKLKSNVYDVILMDIQMPELDGVATTQRIRGQLGMDIPIIAVTANAFKEDIDLYLSIGMNDFVTKPFEEYMLYAAIAKVLKIEILENEETSNMKNEQGLYDLSRLHELSHGNEEFVQKMVGIFKESTPISIVEMTTAFENSDYETVGKLAHKLKPSVENMGIDSLQGKARDIEVMCKDELPDTKDLNEKISYFISELNRVLEAL